MSFLGFGKPGFQEVMDEEILLLHLHHQEALLSEAPHGGEHRKLGVLYTLISLCCNLHYDISKSNGGPGSSNTCGAVHECSLPCRGRCEMRDQVLQD